MLAIFAGAHLLLTHPLALPRLFFEGPNDSEVPEALVEIRQRLRFLDADFFNMRASLTEFSLIYDYMSVFQIQLIPNLLGH